MSILSEALIKRYSLSTMTRQMCFKTHTSIYRKPLHSVVSFARKRFLGLRRTAVEKIVIADRRKLRSSGLLKASCGNSLPTFQENISAQSSRVLKLPKFRVNLLAPYSSVQTLPTLQDNLPASKLSGHVDSK
jgi:hypothetical protein